MNNRSTGRNYGRKRDERRPNNPRFQNRRDSGAHQPVAINPRQVIVDVLTVFDSNPSDPERLIDSALKQKQIDHRDRRFIFEVVYGVIRRTMTLDYIISKYITEEAIRGEVKLTRILKVGIYQLLFMDRVPDHAAVNETVKLVKANNQIGRFASVANAVMRSLINANKIITYPDPQVNLTERLAIEFSHPHNLVDRWMKNFGLARTKKLLQYNNVKPPIYLRRKLREITRQQFEADTRTICEPGSGFMNLYYKLKTSLLPENIRMLQLGLCTVQAPSSGWVVALVEVNKGDRILDMCSAPGGKTTLMAELAGDNGRVCAGDIKSQRIARVVEAAHRLQLENVYPLVFDGEYPPFNGYFDKVLLDAPCTGTGVFNHHPEARWIKTDVDVAKMAEIQKRLLQSASKLIGPGGTIIYSTCSIEPEENELQIEEFLKNNPSFKLDTPPSVIPASYIDNNGFLKITPFDHDMDGIFAARLRKL